MIVSYLSREGELLTVIEEGSQTPISIYCEEIDEAILTALKPRMQLSLLDVERLSDGLYRAKQLVVEPTFLMDITTVASCCKEYGNHALNNLLQKFIPRQTSSAILLGDIANRFLDLLLHSEEGKSLSYREAMLEVFSSNPLGLAACREIDSEGLEQQFFNKCKLQFDHLQHAVKEMLPGVAIDTRKVILEPTFLSAALGLQGRLDLLQLGDEVIYIVELKSGKAKEYPSCMAKAEHEMQVLLYAAMLHYNDLYKEKNIRFFLLYSNYPQLFEIHFTETALRNALTLRNRLVLQELSLAVGDAYAAWSLLQSVTPDRLNEKRLYGNFWDNYLRTPIACFQQNLQKLNQVEKAYVSQWLCFIAKEQWAAKQQTTRFLSSDEKILQGELLSNMTLSRSWISADKQQLLFLFPARYALKHNFRIGDRVMLYADKTGAERLPSQQLFKANIENITNSLLQVSLLDKQRSEVSILPLHEQYAVEHDQSDMGFRALYGGLAQFVAASPQRRNLLMGAVSLLPQSCATPPIACATDTNLTIAIKKAIAAPDFFLLVGPPGTGKTSQALRLLVEHYLQAGDVNILLVAYTNRALDEICAALSTIEEGVQYLRIGNESACEEQYKERMIGRQCAHFTRRVEVREFIERHHVFVATLAALYSQSDLFALKHFEIAMVDEASQILEPQLLWLLAAVHENEKSVVDKYILIGDHKQLPSVVIQPIEEAEVKIEILRQAGFRNLTISFFERIMEQLRSAPAAWREIHTHTLTLQGRMHPDVADFVSTHFYGGTLQMVPLSHQKEQFPPFNPVTDSIETLVRRCRVSFWDTIEVVNDAEVGKNNEVEARIAVWLAVQCYHNLEQSGIAFDPARHIGIITPFRTQIATISTLLQASGIAVLSQITVDTVERFQGSQRDIIIYSCSVNSATHLSLINSIVTVDGVLIDRKLNVALTRSRKQIFVIGNSRWLAANKLYDDFIFKYKIRNLFTKKAFMG